MDHVVHLPSQLQNNQRMRLILVCRSLSTALHWLLLTAEVTPQTHVTIPNASLRRCQCLTGHNTAHHPPPQLFSTSQVTTPPLEVLGRVPMVRREERASPKKHFLRQSSGKGVTDTSRTRACAAGKCSRLRDHQARPYPAHYVSAARPKGSSFTE